MADLRLIGVSVLAATCVACATTPSVPEIILPNPTADSGARSNEAALHLLREVCFAVLDGEPFEKAATNADLVATGSPFVNYDGFPKEAYVVRDAPRIFVAPFSGDPAGCTLMLYDGNQVEILENVLADIGARTKNAGLQGGVFALNGRGIIDYDRQKIWLIYNSDEARDTRTSSVIRESQGYLVSLDPINSNGDK